ncbi:MAG: class A beta-lactamase-related serine hydrolase [Desulfobulbus sp.]|nr:class A beta-lactamase-related serine hydrolase [Desulfobulbus sp.]
MKPRFSAILCSLFLILASTAVAAPVAKHYALAYTWSKEVQRALDDRNKLARALSLQLDSQLQIVGKGNEYGVVYPLNGTLAQARKLAINQSSMLKLAGFNPAAIIPGGEYSKLYHLLLTQSNDPKRLKKEYDRLISKLPSADRGNLQVEKISSRHYGLIYHCWANKIEASKIARARKLPSAKLVAAQQRPMIPTLVSIPTNTTGNTAKMRTRCRLAVSPQQKAQGKSTSVEPSKIAEPGKGRAIAGINSKVQDFLREQRSKGKLQRQERTALVAYDLTNNTYVASINSQSSFQAASMIKPFVALTFFHQVDKGKMHYTSKHRQMMEEMIQHSDNQATNWFIRQLGGPAFCNTLINKSYGRLFRQVRIREYIPAGGKTYKNSALPQDYVQFLKALWNKELPYSQEMLRVMSLPGRDRIFWGTDVPPGTLVYNKTGTTSHLCGDMGILVTKTKNGQRVPYAIVGIVERSSVPKDYKQWMVQGGGVIRDFSSLVYEEMKRKYNLL